MYLEIRLRPAQALSLLRSTPGNLSQVRAFPAPVNRVTRKLSQLTPRGSTRKVTLADIKSSPSLTLSSPASIATQRSSVIARHLSTTSEYNKMNQYTYDKQPSEYTARNVGQPFTLDYRCYVEKNGQPISPFHDIPLYANEQQTVLNMVVEIPRWSNAKQEVSKHQTPFR